MDNRDRSRSGSRSRSPAPRRNRSPGRRRSPSGSPSPKRASRKDYRSRSRSPGTRKQKHMGTRTVDGRGNDGPGGRRRDASAYDDPEPNRVIGVFGLSLFTTERELYHIFEKYGPIDKVQVVLDAQTGRSRGFAFVYFENVDDATAAKDATSGMEIDGRKIRVDYSITTRAHTPTPGIYMGRPTRGGNRRGGYRDDYGGYRGPRRSPSPYRGGKDRYYGGGGRRSRSPYGGGRRSRSPYGGGRRSRSPYGGGRRSRSPSPYRS